MIEYDYIVSAHWSIIVANCRQFRITPQVLRLLSKTLADRWACPSLTASSVKPAADIEAFRVFSDTIRAEIAEETAGKVEQAARQTSAVLGRPTTTLRVAAVPTAQQPITEQTIKTRQGMSLTPSCTTFLTSLARQEQQQTTDDEIIDEELPTGASGEHLRATAEAASSATCGNQSDINTDRGKVKGGNIGGRRGVHMAGSHGGASKNINSSDTLVWLNRKSDIEAIVSAATGIPTKAADPGSEGIRGIRMGPGQEGRRCSTTEAFDAMRAALTSAG